MVSKLHKKVRSLIMKAITTFGMINDGDKVLLGVSGGKDSMLLAKMLVELRDRSHLNFDLKAVYVKRDFINETISFEKLLKFFNEIGLEIEIFPMKIPENSRLKEGMDMSCQRCSYARRITLFKLCEKWGYNKIALGHHLDDEIITLFMNMINNRRWALMPPINKMKLGDITIIRPLSFVREIDIIHLVAKENIPYLTWTCPIGDKSRRKDIGKLVELMEKQEPGSVENMYYAAVKEFIKCYKDKDRITD